MACKDSILVLGAGELGLAVLRSLTTHNQHPSISVLLRPTTIKTTEPQKAAEVSELTKLGITLVAGDIVNSSTSELAALFKSYHTIISCTGFVGGPRIQLKIANAVLTAGVKRYFPWQFGVDYDVIGRGSAQDLFDEQLDVRTLLRSQNATEWVIISTGMFTSFLFEPFFGVVDLEKGEVRALGSLATKVTVTTPEDIGKLTAEVVFEEPKVKNEVVYTAGDTITYGRLADVIGSVLGMEIKRVEWPVETLEKELEDDPENPIKKYRVVFAKGTGVSWDIDITFNAKKGIDLVSVDQWANANLK